MFVCISPLSCLSLITVMWCCVPLLLNLLLCLKDCTRNLWKGYHNHVIPSLLIPWLNVKGFIKIARFLHLYIANPLHIYIAFSCTLRILRAMSTIVYNYINCLFLPRVNTNFEKKSFFSSGVNLWNSLPKEMTEAIRLSLFKQLNNNLNKYIICIVCVQGSTENQCFCWVDPLLYKILQLQ